MKLFLVLLVCAVAAAAPKVNKEETLLAAISNQSLENRSIVINALINRLFEFVRRIINNGSDLFNIPPLDPLELDQFHLYIPAGLINLDLQLKKVLVTGVGGFLVHRSNLILSDLSFEIDISVPELVIRAEEYDLVGDIFTAIPIYGKGQARFLVEGFRFQAKLYLKQSEDGNSILLDRIDNASFVIPSMKSELTGAIGGGDIDAIVNAMIDEVIVDYVNRFQGAISIIASKLITFTMNPILDQLDSWKYIAVVLP